MFDSSNGIFQEVMAFVLTTVAGFTTYTFKKAHTADKNADAALTNVEAMSTRFDDMNTNINQKFEDMTHKQDLMLAHLLENKQK